LRNARDGTDSAGGGYVFHEKREGQVYYVQALTGRVSWFEGDVKKIDLSPPERFYPSSLRGILVTVLLQMNSLISSSDLNLPLS
jgi:hypothetical protein